MIYSEYKQSRVKDVDVTVSFEDGILDLDIYLNPPDDPDVDPERVTNDAVAAAHAAVDELFASEA
nr:DUF3194 domain-containing protein [Halocatena pleomorpha]